MIDRQEVIEALDDGAELLRRALDNADIVGVEREKYEWGLGLIESYISDIKELPSAQPEIIRCKDCKYRMPYDWMFSEIYRSRNIDDYSENEIGCQYCDMAMKADDYCSRAERREE